LIEAEGRLNNANSSVVYTSGLELEPAAVDCLVLLASVSCGCIPGFPIALHLAPSFGNLSPVSAKKRLFRLVDNR
jgi:hypothetical protein